MVTRMNGNSLILYGWALDFNSVVHGVVLSVVLTLSYLCVLKVVAHYREFAQTTHLEARHCPEK